MSTRKYTTSKKEKLIDKIGELEKKDDYMEIYKIIQKRSKKPVKKVGESIMMFFHDLEEETYAELDKFLKKTVKTNKIDKTNSEYTEDYKAYSNDEFPDQKIVSAKLKYSNREKNLIKRKRYDETLNQENGSDVVYCEFSVENISENNN